MYCSNKGLARLCVSSDCDLPLMNKDFHEGLPSFLYKALLCILLWLAALVAHPASAFEPIYPGKTFPIPAGEGLCKEVRSAETFVLERLTAFRRGSSEHEVSMMSLQLMNSFFHRRLCFIVRRDRIATIVEVHWDVSLSGQHVYLVGVTLDGEERVVYTFVGTAEREP